MSEKLRPSLRELVNGKGVLAPGVFDGQSARIVEAAGFDAAYMTGYGVSASLLGVPDAGVATQTEMAERARTLTDLLDIPLIADADTGYGGIHNVMRTVRLYERAGVAGLHIEDQEDPKMCGHMEHRTKQVVSRPGFADRIVAAVEARSSDEMLIIGRTDALAPEGIEEAIKRGHLAKEAGADVIFIEAPNKRQLEQIAREFPNVPLLANMINGGKTPITEVKELHKMGYKLVIYPVFFLYAANAAMEKAAKYLREHGTSEGFPGEITPFDNFSVLMGLGEMVKLEEEIQGRSRGLKHV